MRLKGTLFVGLGSVIIVGAVMLFAVNGEAQSSTNAIFLLANTPETLHLILADDDGPPVMEYIQFVGPVNSIYATTNYGPDVYDVDSIIAEATAGAMTDEERALGLWRYVMEHYGIGYITLGGYFLPDNGVQLINQVSGKLTSFGYGLCDQIGFLTAEMARHAGFPARARGVTGHTSAEIYYDGDWHLMDAMFGLYFLDPESDDIASAREVAEDTDERLIPVWADERAYYSTNGLRQIIRENFTSYHDETDDPAAYTELYFGEDVQTRAISLRPGETMTLYYDAIGAYVTENGDTSTPVDASSIAFPSSWSNGVIRYAPEVAALDDPIHALTNLVFSEVSGGWQVGDVALPGELVVPTHSPYFVLEGELILGYTRFSANDTLRLQLRPTSPAGAWQDVWTATLTGAQTETIALPLQNAVYAYETRIVLAGEATLTGLIQETILQISPHALPEFRPGENELRLRYGGDTGGGQLEVAWMVDGRPQAEKQILTALSLSAADSNGYGYVIPRFERPETDIATLEPVRAVNVEWNRDSERNCNGWQQVDASIPAALDYQITLPAGDRVVRVQMLLGVFARTTHDRVAVWVSPEGEDWSLLDEMAPLHTNQEWVYEVGQPLKDASQIWLRFELERQPDAPFTCATLQGARILIETDGGSNL